MFPAVPTTIFANSDPTPDLEAHAVKQTPSAASDQFARQSSDRRPTMASEFLDFLKHNKKWWMAPILAALLILGSVILIGGSGAAPFIYTLF